MFSTSLWLSVDTHSYKLAFGHVPLARKSSRVLSCNEHRKRALDPTSGRGPTLGISFCNRRTNRLRGHSVTTLHCVMAPSTLITFDVDGTLIHSVGKDANKFHKDAFSFAFKKVFGIDASIDEIPHHGSTDKLVARDTLKHRGIAEEEIDSKLDAYCEAMLEYAAQNKKSASTGIQILPGVVELLKALHGRDDMLIALVTGNLEPIGWTKMEELGLLPFFSAPNFGGFGSDHTSRGELVKIAAERARTYGWTGDKHWHVGDTPNDIRAAEYGGAAALGVCTGVFGKEELEKSSNGSAVILPDLSDVDIVVDLFAGITVF